MLANLFPSGVVNFSEPQFLQPWKKSLTSFGGVVYFVFGLVSGGR